MSDEFAANIISAIRNSVPSRIAEELCSVQPTDGTWVIELIELLKKLEEENKNKSS